jgi:hypothetical protein
MSKVVFQSKKEKRKRKKDYAPSAAVSITLVVAGVTCSSISRLLLETSIPSTKMIMYSPTRQLQQVCSEICANPHRSSPRLQFLKVNSTRNTLTWTSFETACDAVANTIKPKVSKALRLVRNQELDFILTREFGTVSETYHRGNEGDLAETVTEQLT